MLVIGLAGGTVGARDAVCRRLVESCELRVAAWSMPGPRLAGGRAKHLRATLEDVGQLPAQLFVVAHVLTEREAKVIREQGGQVWHVFGPVSSDVIIRQGDPLVTEVEGGDRHWLDPIEALSEAILRRQAVA